MMKSYAYIIVGGGIVAGHAAEVFANDDTYREGDLAIISADSALPYDRTQLSKDYLGDDADRNDIMMHDHLYYRERGIDVYLDTAVTSLDPENCVVYTENDDAFAYGELLLATGSAPNTFDIDGADLEGIHYLRTLGQAQTLRQQLAEAEDVVVIGGGYIGMETAAIAAQNGKNVTMIYPEIHLMEHRFFTEKMSQYFEDIYHQHGVTLMNRARVSEFRGEDGHITEVRTEQDGHVKADLVIAGIGATPNTGLVDNLAVDMADDGGIAVDSTLATSIDHIYAAGDIVSVPDVRFNTRLRVPHWDMAVKQGEYWANRMSGNTENYFEEMPYFFSDFFDISYEFFGHPDNADTILHRSDLDDGSFSVWWLKDSRVQAAFLLDQPDEVRTMAQDLIASQNEVNPEALASENVPVYAVE